MKKYKIYDLESFQNLSNREKLQHRKSLFSFVYREKMEVDEDVFQQLILLINEFPSIKPKYDIPFLKSIVKYLKDTEDDEKLIYYYEKMIKLPLSTSCQNNRDFSEYDLCSLDLFKLYCKNNLVEKRKEFFSEVSDNVSKRTLFFMKYNLMKTFFENGETERAMRLFDELRLESSEMYILVLPLKHFDVKYQYRNLHKIILEVLSFRISKEKYYIYKYIYNWMRSIVSNPKLQSICNLVSFNEDFNIIIDKPKEFRGDLSEYIINQFKVHTSIGTIIKIMKSGNGFVKDSLDGKSYFINKINMGKYRVGSKVQFILVDKLNRNKKVKNAIIIGGKFDGKE